MGEIDRRAYTEAQLRSLAEEGRLPGFLSPAAFGPELFRPDTNWQPVHNMAVVRLTKGRPYGSDMVLSIVNAIRCRETNGTHPDVVSTPTKRMTNDVARALIAEKSRYKREGADYGFTLTEVNPARPQVAASFTPNAESLVQHSKLPNLVTELLTAKLGIEALTANEQVLWRHLGKASLSRIVAGFSYVADNEAGEALYEPLVMFGSVVSTGVIPLPLPAETAEYRNMTWTPVADFPANVAQRNVAGLVRALPWDEVYACVRGLCLATSVQSVGSNDILGHMGYNEADAPLRHYWDSNLGMQVVGL